MKKFLLSLSLVVLSFSLPNISQATLMGPTYPAPGGGEVMVSYGGPGVTGGITYLYGGFDSSMYSDLYWGKWDGSDIGASLDGVDLTGLENMELYTAMSFPTGMAVWTGFSSFTYTASGQTRTEPLATRLTLQVWELEAGQMPDERVPVALVGAVSVGASSNVGVLAPVVKDYMIVNLLFDAYFPDIGWLPVDEGFNLFHTTGSGEVFKTFSGGFYYTASASVPDASIILLLGSSLIGLVGFGRRKVNK